MSDDSSELKFLYVMDGTIFTTLDDPSKKKDQLQGDSSQLLKPSYGYLALVVFDNDYWKKISPLKVSFKKLEFNCWNEINSFLW